MPVIIKFLDGVSGEPRPSSGSYEISLLFQRHLSFGHLKGDSSGDATSGRRSVDLLVGEDGAVDRRWRIGSPFVVVARQNGSVEKTQVVIHAVRMSNPRCLAGRKA